MNADSVQDCLDRARVLGKTLEAELLLASVLSMSREQVYSSPHLFLNPKQSLLFENLWDRFQAGEPLAYLLGSKEFYGLNFKVDSRVLIPRPETEHLVEAVPELAKGIESPKILDVGTGCGAIALALKSVLPLAQIWGSDISPEAVSVAKENAGHLKLDVDFFVSNLLTDLPPSIFPIDVLVANLPYIGEKTFHFVEKSVVDYEPHVALFGGSDGLRLYERLFEQVLEYPLRPKWILGEFGSLQRESMESMIRAYFPTESFQFHQDLAGLDRYFVLTLKE